MSNQEGKNIDYYVGIVGSILTITYYVLSTHSFLKIKSESPNNLEQVKFYKILFNYTASFFGYFFADLNFYEEMSRCNLFAILFNLSFLIVYVFFQIRIDLVDAILNILMIAIASLTYFHYFYEILVDEFIFGLYYMGANSLVLIYFIYDNFTEYKLKSKSRFTFYSNIGFTLAAVCWFIYGIWKKDYYCKIIFGLEILFGSWFIFGHKMFSYLYKGTSEEFKDITNEDFNNNQNSNMNNTIEFEESKTKKYENI